MAQAVFTAAINLPDINLADRRKLKRDLQIAVYDVLDENGIDYQTHVLGFVTEEKSLDALIDEQNKGVEDKTLGGFRSSDPETSRKGAIDAYPRTASQRWKALIEISKSGDQGLTYAEVELKTDVNDVWKRLSELRDGGWIEESGERVVKGTGSMATIWKVTPKAERHIETKEKAGVLR